RRVAYVKGIIFYHPRQTPPAQLPEQLSPAHLKGVWLYHSELDWLTQQYGEAVYQIREKPDWLSPSVRDPDDGQLLTFSELKQTLDTHFQEHHRPLMLSVLKPEGTVCQESERLFVVSENWPEQD
ncbi:MAG: DUF1853 family protein, partial [Planctomycetaceae bacterium]|nr:DUF1853 family protein [Planctomycetaceae bacterium]